MHAKSVRDLGAQVRSARRAQGMTQADLASRLGVSRDWVVRLEQGHPRLEVQRVLDALAVLGLSLDVRASARRAAVTKKSARSASPTPTKGRMKPAASAAKAPKSAVTRTSAKKDPFDVLFKGR